MRRDDDTQRQTCTEGQGHEDTQAEAHVMTEIGGMRPQAERHQGLPAAPEAKRKAGNGFPPGPQRAQLCHDTLISDFRPQELGKNRFLLFQVTRSVVPVMAALGNEYSIPPLFLWMVQNVVAQVSLARSSWVSLSCALKTQACWPGLTAEAEGCLETGAQRPSWHLRGQASQRVPQTSGCLISCT